MRCGGEGHWSTTEAQDLGQDLAGLGDTLVVVVRWLGKSDIG